MSRDDEPSYIDYEAFLDPDFSATCFANTLVLATNNASDTPLDLSTPLSRVLFDVQEVDTHIDTLTTKSALPLLEHTRDHAESSGRILAEVEGQVASLTESYKTLEKEVIERYEIAEQVRLTAERLVETVRLGRAVARCLMLGRQLEVRMSEVGGVGSAKKEDHRAMVRSADTILSLRQIFTNTKSGQEGEGLDKVNAINTLKNELVVPGERNIASRAQQVVKEFSMSSLLSSGQTSASTFAQTEDTKSRTTSALQTLYLLSPRTARTTPESFEPTLMLTALQDYLQTSLKSSLASLARALTQLPQLERTLLEISARCQNIVALQSLLSSTKPPVHPLLSGASQPKAKSDNFLQPLLAALDTSSLPSYFWRSLASNMAPRMQEIMYKGGVSARTLRSNKERVRDAVRECVDRGSRLPGEKGGRKGEGWEREAAVMVGSVVGGIK
ncbi:golgi transport complex component Cog5 [Didymella exigua CBS 183.55]|uniref:Conserved oligomeric Golgi complex subunit 5 n=1 Tax=Didymella exigua CBS 183.55 TaxID=1150837 RepID=A0A6A5RNA7_9PLEO|nr:golgi transport complex component Cog5 [Didymella exigua CBS 183.55]KAF1929129.1 golgi transport complex component Cog5 [Didymella exigua CBS 183.55]